MSTIASKQINKVMGAPIRVGAFAALGTSNTVTSAITTALGTAGDGGVSVPLQISTSNGLGVVTTGANNRIEIYNATSKDKILSPNGEEVYGRLTESGGIYTLSYFTLPDTGVETAYSLPSTSIDFEFTYRFDFARLPTDAIVLTGVRNISNDPSGNAGKLFRERITVTGTNTLNNLTKTPTDSNLVVLIVNGISYDTFATAPFSVNLSTRVLTWSAANAGFSLETTDRVIAQYVTFE